MFILWNAGVTPDPFLLWVFIQFMCGALIYNAGIMTYRGFPKKWSGTAYFLWLPLLLEHGAMIFREYPPLYVAILDAGFITGLFVRWTLEHRELFTSDNWQYVRHAVYWFAMLSFIHGVRESLGISSWGNKILETVFGALILAMLSVMLRPYAWRLHRIVILDLPSLWNGMTTELRDE